MSDTPLNTLDPRIRKQLEKAKENLKKGNASITVDLCMGMLESFPGCLEAREVLRQAQGVLARSKKANFFSNLQARSMSKLGEMSIKKDPAKAMVQAEKILTTNPKSIDGHRLLGDAAMAASLPHTASFAYEHIRDLDPENADNLKALVNAYLEAERIEDALRTGERLLKLNPADGDSQELIKRASVAQSMKKGRWEEETDFREKLKDSDEATKLEQQGRSMTDEENLQRLIRETREKVQNEPDNINHYKQLSNFYHRLGDHENAIAWVQQARQTESGKSDVTLERLEAKLYHEMVDKAIREKEAELEQDPDNAQLREELESMREERKKALREQAEEMVRRYPNDYTARFQLGEILFEDGETDKAIEALQIAQKNPKVRIPSLTLLGKAYKRKRFLDLAAEQFEKAKGETTAMNDAKKDIIYELAECYELMEETEKAMNQYKEIYATDIGFRDVAKKIEAFYANR